ncbi:MAG TPA: histidine kinase [Paludibacteraceae bacterium]|nr:histidine kinase [Paludibacteraceae bacterium]
MKKTDNEPTPFSIFADLLIFAVLLTGASTTLKLTSRWITEENMRREIEREQLKTELTLLKYQVSPHFLMNTLNNIHALIDLDVDRAKDAVIKLSLLMRYLLYDSAHGKTTLRKELEFIESYISLMKIRYPKNVVVEYIVPAEIPDISIPPMLFISFLENAFKHGISYRAESYIHFKLEITAGNIICQIRNSKHSSGNEPVLETKTYSGIGLANIRKNLQLLYSESYTLNINDRQDEFEVNLTLPLHREN